MSALNRDLASLWDMNQAIIDLQSFLENVTYEDYEDNLLLHRAIERELEILGEAARRLSSQLRNQHPEIQKFGDGKTHALTLSYHWANSGPDADPWPGVGQILRAADLESSPKAETAIFVGTEFDSLKGRGGDDGTSLCKTLPYSQSICGLSWMPRLSMYIPEAETSSCATCVTYATLVEPSYHRTL